MYQVTGWEGDVRRWTINLGNGLNGEVVWQASSPSWQWSARAGFVAIATGAAADSSTAMRRCEAVLNSEAVQ